LDATATTTITVKMIPGAEVFSFMLSFSDEKSVKKSPIHRTDWAENRMS
jgi:hypothetical protein